MYVVSSLIVLQIKDRKQKTNLEVIKLILARLDKPESLIKHITDRPGHDRRYAVDTRKIKALGWVKRTSFDEGMRKTVLWYRRNEEWWRRIKEGSFRRYYSKMYRERIKGSRRERGAGGAAGHPKGKGKK